MYNYYNILDGFICNYLCWFCGDILIIFFLLFFDLRDFFLPKTSSPAGPARNLAINLALAIISRIILYCSITSINLLVGLIVGGRRL